MYEKCITCNRIGETCVPNLMRLPFPDLMEWCNKRQKYLGWTNQVLAYRSSVPIGTISRIKAGDYLDCKYSTIRSILITLIGGTTDEWPCNAQVEQELQQVEELGQQAAMLAAVKAENEELKNQIAAIVAQHRADIRAIREEYLERINFLRDELKSRRSVPHQ